MSELKSYKLFHRASALTSPEFLSVVEFGNGDEVYDKYEADKVIALLKDKANYNEYAYKLKSEELSETCRFYEKELRHQKYKRSLAMAKWCDAMKSYFNESAFFDVYANERMVFYERWHNRWLKIAEQFKDKEAK